MSITLPIFNAIPHERTRPVMKRKVVTPTATTGRIRVFIHWNDTSDTSTYTLGGVILKEAKYEDNLSCYEDQDILMSRTIPTNTADAIKGDIVLAEVTNTSTCLGWIFDGTTWQTYHSYS